MTLTRRSTGAAVGAFSEFQAGDRRPVTLVVRRREDVKLGLAIEGVGARLPT